jgi:hypothetical protein
MVKTLLLIGTAALLSACAHQQGPGTYISSNTDSKKGLVTEIKNPCDGESAVVASPDGRVGSLRGVSRRHSVLGGLVEWGSNGVGRAAQKGGIKEVDTVERGKTRVIFGVLYANDSTVVTGDGDSGETPSYKSYK